MANNINGINDVYGLNFVNGSDPIESPVRGFIRHIYQIVSQYADATMPAVAVTSVQQQQINDEWDTNETSEETEESSEEYEVSAATKKSLYTALSNGNLESAKSLLFFNFVYNLDITLFEGKTILECVEEFREKNGDPMTDEIIRLIDRMKEDEVG